MKCKRSCCGTTFRSDAGIQGWLLPGLGDIILRRDGASISSALKNKRRCLEPGWVLFLFIYIALFHYSPFKYPPLTFIKNSVGFSTVLHHIKSRGEIQNRIKTFHLKADVVLWIYMCACFFFFFQEALGFQPDLDWICIPKIQGVLGEIGIYPNMT